MDMGYWKKMNLPNKITMIRFLMIPLFILVISLWHNAAGDFVAFLLFAGAACTDFIDGHIARSRNLITDFGKFMDPLADKLLVCSAMIALVGMNRLASWIAIIIIAREFIISGFRLIAAENGVVIAANYWGKFKTTAQMIMIILLILNFDGIFHILARGFVWISLALTIISLLTYIMENKNVLSMQE